MGTKDTSDLPIEQVDKVTLKSRHVYLTDHQWAKIAFTARLLEHKKDMPAHSTSRQVAFQSMVNALPDPPAGWSVTDHATTIDFDACQLNSLYEKPVTLVAELPAGSGQPRRPGGKSGGKRRLIPQGE